MTTKYITIQNNITNESSKKIAALKAPLIFFVVLSHVHNIYTDIETFEKIIAIITKAIVPCFFLISGYFFLKGKPLSYISYKEKIFKRFKTLFIPYVLWNIMPLLVPLILCFTSFLFTNQLNKFLLYFNEVINDFSPVKIFWNCRSNKELFYPANFPMWYIRDLILVIITSPIIYFLLNKLKIVFLLLCIIAFIAKIPFTNAILFFSIGMFLSYNKIDIISLTHKYKEIILSISLIVFCLTFYDSSTVLNNIYPLIGTFSLFSLISICPYKLISFFHKLSKYCFFIYAVHAIYIYRVDKIIYKYTPDCFICHLSSYILVAIVSYFIGILMYIFLKKLSPKSLSILCGNRI